MEIWNSFIYFNWNEVHLLRCFANPHCQSSFGMFAHRSALAEVTNMLQERQHRWMEIEDLCQFTIASDGLFGNMSKKSRRSSLQRALADVTSMVLSVPPTQDTIDEEGSASEKSESNVSSSDVKNSRENSFDSGSGGSSSASRQVSMISTQSSVQSNKENSDNVSLGGKSDRRSSNQSIPRIRRASSEKFGNLSDGRKEKKLQRVNTEPIDMSKRALSNAMNGRPRSSGDIKFEAAGGGGGQSSGKIFTAQSVDELNRSSSNHSLNDTNDDDDISTNGNISDDSMASSVSITTKKKKKGIHGIKNIFHRKHKVDR